MVDYRKLQRLCDDVASDLEAAKVCTSDALRVSLLNSAEWKAIGLYREIAAASIEVEKGTVKV